MNGAVGALMHGTRGRTRCAAGRITPVVRSSHPIRFLSKAVIPIRSAKVRARPKGRPVDPKALAEIGALLADSPRRRDLLIEYLHKIQDRHGRLSAAQVDKGTTERSSILRFSCVWPMAMVWRCLSGVLIVYRDAPSEFPCATGSAPRALGLRAARVACRRWRRLARSSYGSSVR